MGIEMAPLLRRVEVTRRWKRGRATYREVFFEGHTLLIVRCGIGPTRAAAAVKGLDILPSALLSVGTAGSLVAGLGIGDIVVSSETVWETVPDEIITWPRSLVASLSHACESENLPYTVARLVTVKKVVVSIEERQKLHQSTGASAVDMESHAIGVEARKLGVPFAAVRVVSDDLSSDLLPDPRRLKLEWRDPRALKRELTALIRWRIFLRNFRRVVQRLPPIAIRFVRESAVTWDRREE
jgi:adenosylhomocysteine nucleosidase